MQSARSAVYQVMSANGTIHSEHDNAQVARQAAAAIGGRVRVTSKSSIKSP